MSGLTPTCPWLQEEVGRNFAGLALTTAWFEFCVWHGHRCGVINTPWPLEQLNRQGQGPRLGMLLPVL